MGMFGAAMGAIIASQDGYFPYPYAPPVYYAYPNSSYNPYAFGPGRLRGRVLLEWLRMLAAVSDT
jgi:hypothetical protein